MNCRRLQSHECPEAWAQAPCVPNAEFDHFHLVCRLRPEVLEPYVLWVEPQGPEERPFVLVGRLERHKVVGRLGYLRIRGPDAVAWVGVYGGRIGQPSRAQVRTAMEHLAGLLRSGGADLVVLHGVREDEAFGPLDWWRCAPGFPVYGTPPTPHYRLHLSNDPEFLWKRLRSKHRAWLRGRERRLAERTQKMLEWQWHREFSELERLMGQLEAVASKTYQRKLGAGFRDDREHRERFQLFARQGILRIQTLAVKDRILAFWIGTVVDSTFYSAETGYDPELSDFEPGKLVFFRMVEMLVHERVEMLDFGIGDADYKRRFADSQFLERDVYVFGRTAKAWLAAAVVGGCGRVHNGLKRWLARGGVVNRVRTWWRRRLTSKETPRNGDGT